MGWLDSDSFSTDLVVEGTERVLQVAYTSNCRTPKAKVFTAVNIFVLLYCSSVSFFISMFTLLLSLLAACSFSLSHSHCHKVTHCHLHTQHTHAQSLSLSLSRSRSKRSKRFKGAVCPRVREY